MAQFLSIRKALLHNRGTLGTLALLVGFVLFFVSPCKVYQIAKKVLLGLFSSTRQKRNGNENVNENVNENGRRMTNVVPPVQQGSSSQSTSTAGQHMAMQLSKNFQNMKHVFKMTCSLSCFLSMSSIKQMHSYDIQFHCEEAKLLLRYLATECTNIDLYLIALVECDAHQEAIQRFFEITNPGIVVAQESGSSFAGVNTLKLLFCEKTLGVQAIVRQLEPMVHLDGDVLVVENLQRFIPNLILLSNTNSTRKQFDNIFHIITMQHLAALLTEKS